MFTNIGQNILILIVTVTVVLVIIRLIAMVFRKISNNAWFWSELTDGVIDERPWRVEAHAVLLRRLLQPWVDAKLALYARKLKMARDRANDLNNRAKAMADKYREIYFLGEHQRLEVSKKEAAEIADDNKKIFQDFYGAAEDYGFSVKSGNYEAYLKEGNDIDAFLEIKLAPIEEGDDHKWIAFLKGFRDVSSTGDEPYGALGNFAEEHQDILKVRVTAE